MGPAGSALAVAWDPDRYLRFANHRTRPGIELLARVPDIEVLQAVDLGSGTGELTSLIAERWPAARVTGIDSSPEMVARARSGHTDIEWVLSDIAAWDPEAPVDLLFSNAALHWLDDHENLFARLRSLVRPGGVVAVQMPDNWAAPTHRAPADILDGGDWPEAARQSLMRDRLSDPGAYARWLEPADVDLWRTTYFQRLTGDEPVWTWTTGSVLRPVLAALDDTDQQRFEAECKKRYAEAYPEDADGITVLPFSRLFVIATAKP
ncbi:MAG: methyltransferase domain-containing protein [Acidimicrobiia bacterium]|nr:methyltransferase domain-containing protein [Acidimicrobiia bacterium]NNC74557.1 methyltransferase domain-containing protein [Acidimicrobiia bacterium]